MKNKANERRITLLLVTLASLFPITILINILVVGVAFDNHHFGDIIFILGAAWRDFSGFEPSLDFGHFYGGFVAKSISLTMTLLGPSIFAYDYATILLFVIFITLLSIISWRRISPVGFAASSLIVAVLFCTRYPLEMGSSITSTISARSFLYNRAGLVDAIMCCLFVMVPSKSKPAELVTGVLAGLLVTAAALSKPTFAILGLGVFLGLLVQIRWYALLGLALGLAVGLLIIDPLGERIRASFDYVIASVGERNDASILSLIRKTVQLTLVYPFITLVILFTAWQAVNARWATLKQLLAGLCCVGASIGMAATMGGGGSLGQQALPILIITSIALAELARHAASKYRYTFQLLPILFTAAFAISHLANLVATTLEGYSNKNNVLITSGPLAHYLNIPDNAETSSSTATQYTKLADGIIALTALGDQTKRGIISDSGISFEFAMSSKPVAGFPLWPRAHSPEFTSTKTLPKEVDLILLGHGTHKDQYIGPVIRNKMQNEFLLCQETDFWEIFARRSTAPENCLRN